MGKLQVVIVSACVVGMCLSGYALYVENRVELDESYEAVCDLDEHISCSKVFSSEYGRIFSYLGLIPKGSVFDLPNAMFGLLFYLTFIFSSYLSNFYPIISIFLLFLSVVSLLLSAYLSYILSEILNDICLVCYTTYLCNFLIFLCCSILSLPEPSIIHVKSKHSKEKRK